jgi:hypothetical protein
MSEREQRELREAGRGHLIDGSPSRPIETLLHPLIQPDGPLRRALDQINVIREALNQAIAVWTQAEADMRQFHSYEDAEVFAAKIEAARAVLEQLK